MAKIFESLDLLLEELSKVRDNKKLVFTNGCFDILHPGHVYILREAARLGEILVVGVNSDSSIKRIKGPSRPVFCQEDRMEILGALWMVDYIILFDDATPLKLIKKIKPQVLVKGGEYKDGEIVGENIAEETVRVKMKPGYSTSGIIKRIEKII